MQTKFTKYFTSTLFVVLLGVISTDMLFTSCSKDDEGNNGTTILNSYGPMPIARGAELRFIGKNLDKVTTIVLPGNIEIAASEFGTKSSNLVTITVPQNAIEGFIVLKTPDGDITTKTPMGFSEPISIANFSPSAIKADSILTINGDYLNLVHEVIFTDRVAIGDTDFIVHTRYQIQIPVPPQAQTGKISVSNGTEDPIIVYSATNLTVKLPIIANISPNPVKAGTDLTITGNHLDLVTKVIFGGNKIVTTFGTQTLNSLILEVPEDAKDGVIMLQPASGVNVESADPIEMVVPTVSVTPTTLKNGEDITVTGTNLDLIDKVIFGGDKQGTVKTGGTATQIVVTSPDDAISGIVAFTTKADKTVNGPILTMTNPTFDSFTPASAKAKTDILLTGTNFDLVTDVIFVGEMKGTIGARTLTSMTVTVPVGAKTGNITLKTKNGTLILSATSITILANLPVISSFTEPKGTPGQILTLNGTNMLLIKELIFPGEVKATAYGVKSDSKVEVYVPEGILTGYGKIKIITYEGEEGLSPEIFMGGTDPITASTIMISNFDGGGASQSTWGSVVTFGTPSIYLNGTACMLGLTGDGWQWTWSHNWDTRPVLANPENYVLKFDICITTAAPGVEAGMTLKGWDTAVGLGQPFATSTNGNWITMTFDVLTSGMVIDGTGDWGIWINGSNYDLSGIMIDNLRFDPK